MKQNRDKEVYNSKICIYCKNQDICDKNCFGVFVVRDKVTMRCPKYEYNKPIESLNSVI